MIIDVSDLSFSYGKGETLVIDNISFSIEKGAFVGIFGPNGGGKTTLLGLLLGLLKPSKGKIAVLGTSPQKASARVGYVPQMRRFDKQFPITVFEVVLQGLLSTHKGWGGFSKKAKQQALEALEQVGLSHYAKKPFGELSGGQTQRVLIARALAGKPELLLLDEATAGIDPVALEEVISILLELKGKMTILLVTHELQSIARAMDYLLCINQTATRYTPQQVCGHFALGLYHPPLTGKKPEGEIR